LLDGEGFLLGDGDAFDASGDGVGVACAASHRARISGVISSADVGSSGLATAPGAGLADGDVEAIADGVFTAMASPSGPRWVAVLAHTTEPRSTVAAPRPATATRTGADVGGEGLTTVPRGVAPAR